MRVQSILKIKTIKPLSTSMRVVEASELPTGRSRKHQYADAPRRPRSRRTVKTSK